ncbi:TolB family protein [Gloeocapsa sp. PCC 73106]|uniref:TolB family protein n=1 Tax=Gloeocapsa sp. PCC 73106 TaxID=102232 RepID=UPI0002ACC50E|nr:TolB family protein [Gloeocapsa sp. PCC 73106]ELR96684.1 periplasmic component of the Tol biopolymer transport system [Gloeocapsa sp. PCC 73106]
MFNRLRSSFLIIGTLLLTSCTTYPRFVNFPFDPSGRSLNSLRSELNPQITPKFIVFASDRNGSQDVYLYDLRNRTLINLPGLNALNEIASDPSVSEDGRYIVFATSVQGKSTIYLYDRSTQQRRNLSNPIQGDVRNPTISANGELIAFEVGTNGQWDIFICDRQGQPK